MGSLDPERPELGDALEVRVALDRLECLEGFRLVSRLELSKTQGDLRRRQARHVALGDTALDRSHRLGILAIAHVRLPDPQIGVARLARRSIAVGLRQ